MTSVLVEAAKNTRSAMGNNILNNCEQFLDELTQKVNELGIDVFGYELDHVGYQSSSNEDYDRLKPEFREIGEMVAENIVGGRRVGIFKLERKLKYRNYAISAIELIAPKADEVCPSALEHAEFVIPEDFETFMKKYPTVAWDISSVSHDVFPMVKLKLSDHTQVKFHKTNVLKMVANRLQGR